MSGQELTSLDGFRWHPRFTISRYSADQVRYARKRTGLAPDYLGEALGCMFSYPELGTLHGEGNGVTAGGLDNMARVLTGTGGHPLTPGRVAFGVGTDASDFDVEQVRLGGEDGEQPGRTWYRPMDPGYPQPVTGGIEGQATFAEEEACFEWHEWCMAAGPVRPAPHHALHHALGLQGGVMVNRRGSAAGYGLKEPGVAWVFRFQVSLR